MPNSNFMSEANATTIFTAYATAIKLGLKAWIGTTAEWDQLTDDQKKQYQVNFKTDDCSEESIEVVKKSIADDFSASVNYNEGEYCYHLGDLYKFTSAHSAGAWSSADVEQVQVGDELSELKSTLIAFPNYSDSGVWLLNNNTNYPYTYTVQSDGFLVFLRCKCSNNDGERLTINGNQMITCSGNLEFYGGTFPVKKGDILVFSNLSTLSRARFVYAL